MTRKLLISALCAGGLILSGVQAMAQESPIDTVAAAADSAVPTNDKKKSTTETTTTAENNKKLRDPNQIICKKSVKTSTRLRRSKICKTRATWDAERVATAKQLNDIRSQTSVDRYD
jgi:K+-transporting ATPase c subunit